MNLFSIPQNFIRRCLCYRQDERPDVLTLSGDSYLQPSSSKRAPVPRPTSPAAAAAATQNNSINSNFTGLFS